MIKKKAYTLVEVLMAIGVLSLFLIGAFNIFSSSSKNFKAGTWRLENQRAAQQFLLRFKETLEKANHANYFMANGTVDKTPRNIYISSNYYNKTSNVDNKLMLCGSIVAPAYAANPALGVTGEKGTWKGFAIQFYKNKLKLYQTGKWNSLYPPLPEGTTDVSLFPINNTVGDFNITLDNVTSIGFYVSEIKETLTTACPECLIRCEVTLTMPNSGNRTKITESITAKVSDRKANQIIKSSSLGNTASY